MRFLRSHKLVRDTLIYTVTDGVGKAISFILLPILSYYLSPEGLGLATNFVVFTTVVNLLAGQAILNALQYFYYEHTKHQNSIMVSNLVWMTLVACAFLLVLTYLFNNQIYSYLQLDLSFQIMAFFYAIAFVFTNINLQLFRLEDKPKSFALFQIIQIVIHCILVVLFVIVWKKDGEGKIYAEFITVVLMGVLNLLSIIKRGYLLFEYDKSSIKKLLKFGVPLMPHSISFWFKSGADKVFITNFAGLAQNGIYSIAMSISSLYTLVSNAFFNAYVPTLQKKLTNMNPLNEREEKIKIVKTTYLMIGFFFIISLLSILGAWVILKYMVADKYESAFNYIPGVILSLYIYVVYTFAVQFVYKKKKTLVLGILTFTGSLIQMVLSYCFVKNYGPMGAVYSSIVGSVIISVSIFYYSNKVFPMPWLFFLNRQ